MNHVHLFKAHDIWFADIRSTLPVGHPSRVRALKPVGPLVQRLLEGELFEPQPLPRWREIQPGVYVAPMGTRAPLPTSEGGV